MRATNKAVSMIAAVGLAAGLLSPRTFAHDDFGLGARAAALGGAFVARADDPSALFSNPAGLAFLKGLRVKTNLSLGPLSLTATRPSTGVIAKSSPSQFNGTFVLTWQFIRRLTVGIGIFSPFNQKTEWPNQWSGNSLCISSRLTASYLRPAVSVEVLRNLSFGFGVDLVSADVGWSHAITLPFPYPTLNEGEGVESVYGLSGRGRGFACGLLWKAHALFQVGVTYQDQVPVDFKGDNSFLLPTTYGFVVPGPDGGITRYDDLLHKFYRTQPARIRLTLPRKLVFGLMSSPLASLSFHLDLQWTGWSGLGAWEFRSVNDNEHLSPDFTAVYQSFYGVSPDYGLQGTSVDLKDAWSARIGAEYRPAEHLAVRGGFAYAGGSASANLNPVNPDLTQNALSAGFGYEGPLFALGEHRQISELSFDVFVRYAFSQRPTSSLPAYELTYRGNRWAAGVGVGLNL